MKNCPKCGGELTGDGLEGLCGACLMAEGFETIATTASGGLAAADPEHALEYDGFGPYTILRVLGEGGMGTVYLAEQRQPIHRMVAIKVVKPGMDTRQILNRFAYERQALALMDHPNIARVYDASATEKGRPYFVMEYINGVAITEYCDSHRLNTAERLELFLPVCQALQHAHQKGVIHRDLKPSNVLVTEQDGRPVAKVIDFGIAKATGQQASDATMLTQFGQFVGTPEYISPEQADLVTNGVDTSSDVYSLGIVLYELLVGAVPFDRIMLRKAGLAEILRIIREEEAPPLPAKLTEMGQAATQVAERRRTDPITLRRQVAGDLNWIVMKAVEKTGQRRYPSVSELAADIRRHLEDQPVLASPPSRMYRAQKFVRRHRAGVLAASGVAAALGVRAGRYRLASIRSPAGAHPGAGAESFGRTAWPGGAHGTGARRIAGRKGAAAGAGGRAAEGARRGAPLRCTIACRLHVVRPRRKGARSARIHAGPRSAHAARYAVPEQSVGTGCRR